MTGLGRGLVWDGIFVRRMAAALLMATAAAAAAAEVCTTQSQMKDGDRQALVAVAQGLTKAVQANDVAGLRARTDAELAKDFAAVTFLVASTAPKVSGGTAALDQVYLLDATQMKTGANGSEGEAQFFCSLNRSVAEADFAIPGLHAGMYGFATVRVEQGSGPWRISYLLHREGETWTMAGIYPAALTAAGHDGLWYWRQARQSAAVKQSWNAWLEFAEAETLLRPAAFVDSTHLEKLHTEQTSAAPAAVSDGVSAEAPLVIKAADGAEFHVTSMRLDDAGGKDRPDVAIHVKVDPVADATVARKRNEDAMRALLGAYPELRSAFRGVAVVAEAAGVSPFATEAAMADIH